MQDLRFDILAKFTPAHRLLRKNGFNHVIRAENVANKHFKIFFTRNSEQNARLGMIVGKKTISGATGRNRLKRFIRETFRQHSIKLCKLDMVVMVRRADAQEFDAHAINLKMLFSRIENRCAELLSS